MLKKSILMIVRFLTSLRWLQTCTLRLQMRLHCHTTTAYSSGYTGPPKPKSWLRHCNTWSAVAGWLASRTLDPRVGRSSPGRSVTRAWFTGKTLPLSCPRVFSDRTLKIVGPFYPVSMSGEVKDGTSVM